MSKKKKIKLSKNIVRHIQVIKFPEDVRLANPKFTGSTLELTDELLADGDFTAVVGNNRAAFASFVDKHGTALDNDDDKGVVIRDKVFTDDGSSSLVVITIDLKDTKFELDTHVIVFRNCVFEPKEIASSVLVLSVKPGYEVRFEDCTFFNRTHINLGCDAKAYFSYPNCQSNLTVVGTESKFCSGLTTATFDHAHGIDTVTLTSLDQAYVREGFAPKIIQADECGFLELEHLMEQNISGPMVTFRCGRSSSSELSIKNCRLHENTNIHISDTAATRLYVHSSSIKRIDIRDSVLLRAYFYQTGVSVLKAVKSVCKDFCSNCNSKFSILAATESVGFPDLPTTLYKKADLYWLWQDSVTSQSKDVILKLEVPKEAKKHASSWKYRVSEAKVVAIFDSDMNKIHPSFLQKIISTYDKSYKYKLGKVAKPKQPFEESDADCASGIHGFLTPEEAKNYSG